MDSPFSPETPGGAKRSVLQSLLKRILPLTGLFIFSPHSDVFSSSNDMFGEHFMFHESVKCEFPLRCDPDRRQAAERGDETATFSGPERRRFLPPPQSAAARERRSQENNQRG